MEEEGEVKNDLIVCPDCGGAMSEDDGDASMVKCDKCGYRMTSDEARESSVGSEELN